MNDDWSETLKAYLQSLMPLLSSILLVIFSFVPFNVVWDSNIHAAVACACVHYWLLHRPDVFNLFSVFILGLVEDALTSAPLGASILQLLILYVVVNNLLKYFNGKSFEVMWVGFVLCSFVAMFAHWFIVSVYYAAFLPFGLFFFTFLVTVCAYPLITLFNVFVQNKLMTDEA